MKTQVLILLVLALVMTISCQHPSVQQTVLSQAENLMETKPDSALVLLEGIRLPAQLSEEQYATWCLLVTQARDKSYVEHTSDSLIRIAIHYFDKKKDMSSKALSYFYLGRVQSDLKQWEDAIVSYLKANEYATTFSDDGLKGRINEHLGVLYWDHSFLEKAQIAYQKAYAYYEADKDTIGIIYVLQKMGSVFSALNKPDSAILCLKEALDLSDQMNDLKTSLLVAIGNAYKAQGEYTLTLSCFKQALLFTKNEKPSYSHDYSVASLFYRMAQPDSALLYARKAVEGDDLYVKCAGYQLIYELSFQMKEYKSAYSANQNYILYRDSIGAVYQPQKIAEMEALYKKEKLQKESNEVILKEKDRWNVLLLILLISYVVGSYFFFQYKSRIRVQRLKLSENQCLLQEKEKRLKENQQKVLVQDERLCSLQKLIEEKQEQLKSEDLRIQQLENEHQQIEMDWMFSQKEREREIHTLCEEKKNLVTKQTDLYSIQAVLLREKELLLENNSHQSQTFQAEIQSLQLLQDTLSKEKYTLQLEQECLQASIEKQEQTIKMVLETSEVWKGLLIKQNKFLYRLLTKEPFIFTVKDWIEFEENFNNVFPFFIFHLKEQFPQMQDTEIYTCCFVKLNLKTGSIAIYFCQEANTISKRKKAILTTYFSSFAVKSLDDLLRCWY